MSEVEHSQLGEATERLRETLNGVLTEPQSLQIGQVTYLGRQRDQFVTVEVELHQLC